MVSQRGDIVNRLLREKRLVAIVRLDDLTRAVDISAALLEGGICLQEYTLSNPAALDAIRDVRSRIPQFASSNAALGVGSVRDLRQAQSAAEAGVDFMVTPTLNPGIIAFCKERNIPIISGAFSPTEIAGAWELGSTMVKVFPARALGPEYIKDVLAPMPDIPLMPTGGVQLDNMEAYFRAGAAAVGIGGNLLDKQAINSQQWQQITATARAYSDQANRGNQ